MGWATKMRAHGSRNIVPKIRQVCRKCVFDFQYFHNNLINELS